MGLIIVRSTTDIADMPLLTAEQRAYMTRPTQSELFPPKGFVGECRICGKYGPLTEEHIPPKAAFNKGRSRCISIQAWLNRHDLKDADGPVLQGGVRGSTLCRECNSFTGRHWGGEYHQWAVGAAMGLSRSRDQLDALAQGPGYPGVPLLEVRDVYPGRLARQVISMMLSISGSPALGTRHPTLRELALGGPAAPLPPGMALFMCICAGPSIRIAGGPGGQGIADTTTKQWTFLLEIAAPPLAFQLVLNGDPSYCKGVDISVFTEIDPDEKHRYQVDEMLIGFTHSGFPGDYRSPGQMRVDREAV